MSVAREATMYLKVFFFVRHSQTGKQANIKNTALVLLSQVAAVIENPMTYRCTPGPWSRTWRNRSGRAGPAVATWPMGWGRTRPARRYWLSGTGNPEQLQLSVLSLSPSKRWPATGDTKKCELIDNTVSVPHFSAHEKQEDTAKYLYIKKVI